MELSDSSFFFFFAQLMVSHRDRRTDGVADVL